MEALDPDTPQDHDRRRDRAWLPRSRRTFLTGRSDESYWLLVEQLMFLGWHRLGKRADTGQEWGFRRSFTLPDRPGDGPRTGAQERWIQAATENAAMRQLLREVHG